MRPRTVPTPQERESGVFLSAVTALYEIVPKGERTPGAPRTSLKYQQAPRTTSAARENELMTVAVRFKQPDGHESGLAERAAQLEDGVQHIARR